MNYKYILEHGYEKLSEKLPEEDKAFLKGFETAISFLDDFKYNIGDYIKNDCGTLAKIEKEIAECTIDNAIKYLEDEHDGMKISMVDHNHYSIDENGNITDDNEESDES